MYGGTGRKEVLDLGTKKVSFRTGNRTPFFGLLTKVSHRIEKLRYEIHDLYIYLYIDTRYMQCTYNVM